MARPLRIQFPGAFYHITARGNEQKEIFKSRKDREKFLGYLESAAMRYGALIHAWCLMTNHYHLFLETPLGNLSQIMRHINGAYTTYFNIKRKRAGHLFQGRFKAILVDADEYATGLSRYIHLNPVRAGMTTSAEEYEWSSYRQYIGCSEVSEWLKTRFVLNFFGGADCTDKYRQFCDDYSSGDAINGAGSKPVLGSADFVSRITQDHLREKQEDRNLPDIRKLSRPSLDDIITHVEAMIPDDAALAKKACIYFCHRYSGARLREVGERFGMSDAAVSQASKRLKGVCENDTESRGLLDKISVVLGRLGTVTN